MSEIWFGYKIEQFEYEGHEALVVCPHETCKSHTLMVKTEYFGAFPEAAELPLLERGFHLCFIKNDNRWGVNEDLDRKARFIRFVQAKYDLSPRCVPIGMSCGGLIAVKLAARYPEMISSLYLDAPVINYMSCPCGFGIGQHLNDNNTEILDALGMNSISELLSYREMPLDMIPKLVEHRIPVILVAGDSDRVVPFCENGILVQKAYKDAGCDIEVYLKPGCDHHPHGLPDPKPLVDFIMRHSGDIVE